MKFKIGDKVKILDYICYITDKTSSIPRKLMIHGNCMPRINHNATIVDIYNQYYIVNFINQIDEVMQLGYTEDNLELVSDEFVLPEKWCIKPTETSAEVIFAYFSSINHLYKGYDTSWIISPSSYFVFPQKSIGCWGYSEKPDDYTEITFDQFKKYVLKDTVETIEKPKFEVGKWYEFNWDFHSKTNGKTIIKVKSINDNSVNTSGRIYLYRPGDANFLAEDCYNFKEMSNIRELTDLSEIQQYLPDGHVDKVKVIPEYVRCTLPFSDQTKGNIYKVSPDGYVEDNKGSKSILTWNGGGFEKSTKEAYDAQFKPMEKNEFKKGDYIVIVSGRENLDFIVNNYCYKQYENHNYLIAEIDNKGLGKTRASGVDFDNTNDRWRYATPEEIAEYDRLGEPYDVTTLSKKEESNKSLVGRYLKALIDYPQSTSFKKGEYAKILDFYYEDKRPNKYKIEGDWCYTTNDLNKFELMPEGFVPPTESKAVPKSPKTEDLIDEARRRYPVGTKFHPSHITENSDKFCVITSDCVFIENSQGIYSKVTTESSTICEKWVDNHEHPQYGNCTFDRYVYTKKKGKWAEIVSEEKPEKWKPKVGDWVMISEEELPITGTWLGEGGRVKHQGPFLVEKIESACVRKMSGIAVLLAFGRFRKAEPHEIPKTEEPISGPITKIDGGQAKLAIYDETPLFQLKTSYNILQPKISQDYSKPETLLTKTTLNY